MIRPHANTQQSIKRVVAAVRKDLNIPEKATSFEFLPFVNERSPTGKLLKHNRSISFEKPQKPNSLPKLKTIRQERKTIGLPLRYAGGVPGVGQYDIVPMNKYKVKSPEYKISKLSRSLSRQKQQLPMKEEIKLIKSQTQPKHFLKLPFKAHLQGLLPLNLKNYLAHKSPISDIECPAFPQNFMEIGQFQQDAIKDSLKDMRKLKRELKKKLFS